MAKKTRAPRGTAQLSYEMARGVVPMGQTSETTSPAVAKPRLEEFAEDLGRLLGNAKMKADSWLDQRKAIGEHLTGLRDTATQLLQQLGFDGSDRERSDRGRRPGRPRKAVPAEGELAPAPLSKKQRRKKRTMSPEAREKIAAAQRLRWAKQKRAAQA